VLADAGEKRSGKLQLTPLLLGVQVAPPSTLRKMPLPSTPARSEVVLPGSVTKVRSLAEVRNGMP